MSPSKPSTTESAAAPLALVVDDEAEHGDALAGVLARHGFQVRRTSSVSELQRLPGEIRFRVAFITIECAGENGLTLLEDPRLSGATEILLMNDRDEHALVSRGMANGATYFFCKPFDPAFIDGLAADLAAEERARARPPALTTPMDQFGLLRGGSEPMRTLYRVMRKVAPTDASVLLLGESGTGKELVARTLHMMSHRSAADFVPVNCAAIPGELFESELFGHERGSFSGAVRQHQGYFERAHGGTLFLDEITEMPVELQAKLLRVLEQGRFRRVGGEQDLRSDARIIAASNRDPDRAMGDGRLREDLYYRLARFPLTLPPLRVRAGDVGGLARVFLGELNREHGAAIGITDEAIAKLEAYHWPGNVRELRSVLERAFILANDTIGADQLRGLDGAAGAAAEAETAETGNEAQSFRVSATASVAETEKRLILAALKAFDGDKPAAARSLGISLKTLYNRLNEYAGTD
ncbi:MAG: sigma-54 dependent transcriptional regulator [Pseudomonadales bacterium]